MTRMDAGPRTATDERARQGDRRAGGEILPAYLETLALIERLHRLLLDVIKEEFERRRMIEVNAVQALLLYNIGEHELTAGELRSRGYYQGSNVSYNLKKLVSAGFIDYQRSTVDRRSVRVRLTDRGFGVHHLVAQLFDRHTQDLSSLTLLQRGVMDRLNDDLRVVESYWASEIRYIY